MIALHALLADGSSLVQADKIAIVKEQRIETAVTLLQKVETLCDPLDLSCVCNHDKKITNSILQLLNLG